jgi:hypothetical protein
MTPYYPTPASAHDLPDSCVGSRLTRLLRRLTTPSLDPVSDYPRLPWAGTRWWWGTLGGSDCVGGHGTVPCQYVATPNRPVESTVAPQAGHGPGAPWRTHSAGPPGGPCWAPSAGGSAERSPLVLIVAFGRPTSHADFCPTPSLRSDEPRLPGPRRAAVLANCGNEPSMPTRSRSSSERKKAPRCRLCERAVHMPKGWSMGASVRRHYWRKHRDVMLAARRTGSSRS